MATSSLGALLLGLAFGVVMQRSHFCTMGALSDLFLFGSSRRLRVWLLALAAALGLTQALILAGLTAPVRSLAMAAPQMALPALALGGLLLGFGMVIGGGCPSRNLLRFAGGDRGAGWTLLVFAATAMAIILLGGLALGGAIMAPEPWAARSSPYSPGAAAVAILAAGALAAIALWPASFRRRWADPATGVILGLLIGLGWAVAGSEGASINFVRPLFDLAAGPSPLAGLLAFGPLLVIGTLIGGWIEARRTGTFRARTFRDAADRRRNLAGAACMGVGGALAGGCTFGHGLSGLAMLAPWSVLAVVGMVIGARWALYWLETGRFLPGAIVTR